MTDAQAIALQIDQSPGFVVNPKGTREEFREVLANLNTFGSSIGWAVGAAMNAGIATFGTDALTDIREILSTYDDATLANWSHVDRKFPPEERRTALSLSHHLDVAYLDDEDAHRLLDEAEAEALSVAELRSRRKELSAGDPDPQLPGTEAEDEPADDDGLDEASTATLLGQDPVPLDIRRSFCDLVAPHADSNSPNILVPRALALTIAEAYRNTL